MINFSKHFDAKSRVSSQKILNKNFNKKATSLFCKILNKKINFNNLNHLKELDINDIKKIDYGVRKKYQKEFKKIIYPEIKKFIKIFFNKNVPIRVSCQSKYKWGKDYNKKKFFNPNNKNLNDYNLILSDDLYFKPTPSHQDLSNNGFRSSSVIIFYFQITPVTKYSSLLSLPKSNDRALIYPTYVTKDNYGNAIKRQIVKKLNFTKCKNLKKNSMLIMDALTPHSSTKISKIPRIALNVKIHPTSLNYIYKIYKIKKKIKKSQSKKEKLNILEIDLIKLSKKNRGLLYELSVLNCMQRKYEDMKKNIRKLFYSNTNLDIIESYIAGGIFRKTVENVTYKDKKNIYNKRLNIAKLSCAESILNTIK